MLEYLSKKLEGYRELNEIINQFQKLKRREVTTKDFLDSLLQKYCQLDWELFEKIAEIFSSQEIWKNGNHYKTIIYLKDGRVVGFEACKDEKFIVLEENGRKRKVRFETGYCGKIGEKEFEFSFSFDPSLTKKLK